MSLHQTSGKWRLGLALSLLTAFLWGVLPIALSVVLQALDIYTVTWFRFLMAFGLLGIYLTQQKQLPPISKLRSLPWGLLALAIAGLLANYLLFLVGLGQTSPSNSQVIIQLAPVLMGLGAIAIFKERYILLQWLGLSVLALGLVLFFHEQLRVLVASQTQYLLGSAILVLAAAAWAVYALAQKQLLQRLPSSNIMLGIYGGSAILLTPMSTPTAIATLSPLHLGVLIFCGLNTLIAYGSFAEALEHWEASRVSAVLALTPIVTLVSMQAMSRLFPGVIEPERITGLGAIGAILVVSGSSAIALGRRR